MPRTGNRKIFSFKDFHVYQVESTMHKRPCGKFIRWQDPGHARCIPWDDEPKRFIERPECLACLVDLAEQIYNGCLKHGRKKYPGSSSTLDLENGMKIPRKEKPITTNYDDF